MRAKMHQPQTSIVDLPEDEQELTVEELLLITGGCVGITGFGKDQDVEDPN